MYSQFVQPSGITKESNKVVVEIWFNMGPKERQDRNSYKGWYERFTSDIRDLKIYSYFWLLAWKSLMPTLNSYLASLLFAALYIK